MVNNRYKANVQKLLKIAIEDHKKGYEIEAFSILYECIRYNQSHLVSIKSGKSINIKKYKELLTEIRRNCLLNRKIHCEISSFHNNRSCVVHQIIHKRMFNNQKMNDWFDHGRVLNLKITNEIKKIKNRTLYDELLEESP